MKPLVFNDWDPITIRRFLDQFKRSRYPIGVSEGMALWNPPNFMKEGPRDNFNNLIVSIRVSHDGYARPMADADKICTYVKALNTF